MKRKIFTIIVLLVLIVLCLTACNAQQADIKGKVKVTFDLQGGEYKNSKQPVSFYFGFAEGAKHVIKDMFSTENGYAVKKNDCEVEGWYKTITQTGTDENGKPIYTYSDKWNFENDIVNESGVTLYANWQPVIKFTYQIVWLNPETEVEQTIGSPYIVDAGKPFNDILANATKKKPSGYTFLKFTDEGGNDWDTNFTHPGGTESTEVKVYAQYIKGNWKLIRTAAELKKNASMGNLYLLNDIDMGGASFSFGDFSSSLQGNGYKISNFTVSYDPGKGGVITDGEGRALYVSLFRNVKNATIQNVTFDNVTINLETSYSDVDRIYVCPLCANVTTSTLTNVTVNVNFICTKTPWDAPGSETQKAENLIIDRSQGYVNKDTDSIISNVNINIEED